MGMKATLGLLLAVALLAGCGERTEKTEKTEKTDQAALVPSNPAPTTPRPLKTLSEPPLDAFQQVVAKGTVRITGTCVEVVTEQLNWVLIGPAAAQLRDGQRVQATGVPDPNRETGCTGSPLLVSSVALV
ncbi:hypothetical protein [Dactylosporangium sp. NPDC051541]|uniref:hypothetical protein n=1 Tax=Dactylosporangium sp. NPDC051541 TaxID=3363977 RepID=UPI003788C181